ncbi:energy transducer TonB [Neisseria sp.]|uniref:energy transducer TonB n=1 Tax=Neisseria sp. TaxID=192066 RepID=UPI00359F707B
MNLRKTLTAVAAAALVAGVQTAAAGSVSFYQKASEASSPITGKVAMRLTIGADGDVSNVRVVRSSGDISIDNRAVEWLENQTMRPAFVNGEARDFSVVKEIQFSESGKIQQASAR